MYTLDQLHWTWGIFPVTDAFDDTGGPVTTDIVKCESAVGVFFLIMRGVNTGGTGTALILAQACDTVVPGVSPAVPYQYRESTTLDTWGAWAQATAAGWTCTNGSNNMIQIFVPAAHLAALGYAYCRLSITEPVDDPVVGAIAIAVVQPRYQPVPATLLT